jgi:hypothetical protein
MIVLGVVLMIIGFVAAIPIFWTVWDHSPGHRDRPRAHGEDRTRGGRSAALLLRRPQITDAL